MKFNLKWSELTDEQKKKAEKKYGNKQGWQDAKAKSQGYKDEADKRAQREEARTSSPSPSSPSPSPSPTPSPSSAQDLINKYTPNTASATTPAPGPSPSTSRPTPSPSPSSQSSGDYKKRYDLKWNQLSDKQKQRSGSQEEHKAMRRELGLIGNNKGNNKSDNAYSSSVFAQKSTAFDNVTDAPFQGPLKVDGTAGSVGAGSNDKSKEEAQNFLGGYMENMTYDDSELQKKYDTLSSNYDQLQASFTDLNTNFNNYMSQQQEAEAVAETTPVHTGSEQSNPFGNTTTNTSPFTTSLDNSSVNSYLENFQGIEITPYVPATPSSYTDETTLNPTEFTGYQPQVYTPAMHLGTGNENSVAEQQQMYVSEGGQGFYGAPQVTPTNPFTGQAYELNEDGMVKLPDNLIYGAGTLLPGQLSPVGKQGPKKPFKGIGT